MTIVIQTTPEQIQAIEQGKGYFIMRSKRMPVTGDRLILQHGIEKEINLPITSVDSEGMMKSWWCLGVHYQVEPVTI